MAKDFDGATTLRIYLVEQGHTEEEIAKILRRLAQYDEETTIDSVMESMADGKSDLANMIREILHESDSKMPDDLAE